MPVPVATCQPNKVGTPVSAVETMWMLSVGTAAEYVLAAAHGMADSVLAGSLEDTVAWDAGLVKADTGLKSVDVGTVAAEKDAGWPHAALVDQEKDTMQSEHRSALCGVGTAGANDAGSVSVLSGSVLGSAMYDARCSTFCDFLQHARTHLPPCSLLEYVQLETCCGRR